MLAKIFNDGPLFEREVRAIARSLWPSAEYFGSQIVNDRERDGVFILEDVVHCLECTVSKDEKKARGDLEKLARLIEDMRRTYPKKAVKGWFVTLHEATADQARHISSRRGLINHETFEAFRSKLVDAADLINLRIAYPFGSARDIATNSIEFAENEYIESFLFPDERSKPLGHRQVAKIMREQNRRYVVFGEYGVGKSMTLRQIFMELCRSYKNGDDLRFPVHLNLRDHKEVSDLSEALRQHARLIGYRDENHLVRAFWAGYTIIILDGFDEMSPRVGTRVVQKARELRKSALALVRRFIRDAPSRTPILLAGRSNFFDSGDEAKDALGVADDFVYLSMTEFSDDQIEDYLRRKGSLSVVPPWMPKRPLLIGYFVTRNLGQLISNDSTEQDIGTGWSGLIEAICEREVSQIEIGLYAAELMSLYARIATKARKKQNRLGPVHFEEMKEAFRELFDFEPEDRALAALLRLPGMVSAPGDTSNNGRLETRWFVDEGFMDALAAVDMVNLLENIYLEQNDLFRGVRHQLFSAGMRVAASLCEKKSIQESQVVNSLFRMCQRSPDSVVAVDMLQIARELGLKALPRLLVFSDQLIEELYLNIDDSDFSAISFANCYFQKAYIDSYDPRRLPTFDACYFGEIRTPLSLEVVNEKLRECEFDSFRIVNPVQVIDSIDIRIGVMRSIIDKLYLQSISGREERAFSRGIPLPAQQYVDNILDILRRHNFCFRRTLRGSVVWYPVRSRLPEASSLIQAIHAHENPIIDEVLSI